MSVYPIVLITLGVIVLLLGNRLTVLGAAAGALLGAALLRLFPGTPETWVQLAVVGGLALLGFFAAGFARGVIDVVILVIGALAGAAIVLAILDLFNLDLDILGWILAVIGGVVGFMLLRRSRRGSRDWGMVILASLVGALLITRGLSLAFPSMQDTLLQTLVIVALAAVGFLFQGGMFRRKKAAKNDQATVAATTASMTPPAAVAPPATVTPPAAAQPVMPPLDADDLPQ